jgi:acyl-CoA thioester hydrolase
MTRPEQSFPEHCVTRMDVRVRFGETDLMGIMHHGSYVALLEAARIEYLRRRDFDYLALTQQGIHLPVIEMQLKYRRPARFDDLITVETRLGGLTRVRVDFDYRLLLGDELLVEATTRLACIDASLKPYRLPEAVREMLLQPEAPAH